MQFVKTAVYQATVEEGGVVKESEVEARVDDEPVAFSKSKLPEFEPGRVSLAEQLAKNAEQLNHSAKHVNQFAPRPVTEDDVEFIQSVYDKKTREAQEIGEEESSSLREYQAAQSSRREKNSTVSVLESEEEKEDKEKKIINNKLKERKPGMFNVVVKRRKIEIKECKTDDDNCEITKKQINEEKKCLSGYTDSEED